MNTILAIDGEGYTDDNDKHHYMMMAYSDCTGAITNHIKAPTLRTKDCLDFILHTPRKSEIYAYGFNYDLTKILTDVDDETLYKLFRPELRPGEYGPEPVEWEGYQLNMQGTKFTVKKRWTRTIWDLIKFYQCKFVDALVRWDVAKREDLIHMEHMKGLRSKFDPKDAQRILRYCLSECRHLATLARKLQKANEQIGFPLSTYYGAGTIGGNILTAFGIDKHNRSTPPDMQKAVACAFAGGRFENSVIGRIKGPIYSYDINSAYPYQTTFLPCLECGTWRYTNNEDKITTARAALVNVSYQGTRADEWAPFFFRDKDKCISFPKAIGSCWVYRAEYLSAKAGWEGVTFKGAWVYTSDCQHRPFREIPNLYLERLRLGKDGAGISLKLGYNATYGKLAQSVGHPKFNCWIWAGMITSNTRAQILDAIRAHKDRSKLLWIATDGIYTREPLELSEPVDTGTFTEHKKPLGGWDETIINDDMFTVRPGIYFAVSGESSLRGRGIGRKLLGDSKLAIMDAFESSGKEGVELFSRRFHGGKSSITIRKDEYGDIEYNRSDNYGQWRPWSVKLTFNPMPKRIMRRDGSLALRDFAGQASQPYNKADFSPEKVFLELLDGMMEEQPDGGWS